MLPCEGFSETGHQETINYIGEERETPSPVSNQTVLEVYRDNSERNEKLLAVCEEIYSPLLKSMKFFGLYFGDTSMKKLRDMPINENYPCSLLPCIVTMTGLSFQVVSAFISISVEGMSNPAVFFVLLSNLFWGFKTALIDTISLVVLSITERRTSRFEQFLQKLVESGLDLKKLKSCFLKSLLVAGVVWTSLTITNMTYFFFLPWTLVGYHKPWSEWYGFQIVTMVIILICVVSAWLLPVTFICATSTILEHLFDDLGRRTLYNSVPAWQLDLGAMMEEHRKLCTISDLASKMSPFFLVLVSAHIALTCFCFYVSLHPPRTLLGDVREINLVTFSAGAIYWLFLSVVTIAEY